MSTKRISILIFIFLFTSIFSYNSLLEQKKYDIENYTINILQQIELNKNIPISRRSAIRKKAKENLLKIAGTYLEQVLVDNRRILEDLIRTNQSFSREYSIFLDSLELKNFYFRNNKLYGTMIIPIRGRKGLLSILPLPWNIKEYTALTTTQRTQQAYIQYPYFNEYEKSLSPVKYSGLVIDARDLDLKLSLTPKIFTQSGKLIYGYEFIQREVGVSRGIVGFVHNMQHPIVRRRAGKNYLFALALSTSGKNNTDIVLSEKDAQKLLEHKTTVENLKKCKVVFLIK